VHTHPVGVGVAAFLVGGAIGATVGGALVVRRAREEIQKARSAVPTNPRCANTPKTQQFHKKIPQAQQFRSSNSSDTHVTAGRPGQPAQKQSPPHSFTKGASNLYTS
jgi:hypothetical protein